MTNQRSESRLPYPPRLRIAAERLKIDSRQVKAPRNRTSAHTLLILHGEQKCPENSGTYREDRLTQTKEDSTIQGNTSGTYTEKRAT